MPVLNINGKRVTVDDSFLGLSAEEQNSTVDEIARSIGVAPAQEPQSSPDNTPSMKSYEPTLSDRAFGFAKSMGLPAQRMRSDLGAVGSFIDQLGQGLTFGFSDEAEAGLKTGFGLVGDYGKALEGTRGRMAYNQEVNPGTSTAGALTGGLMLGAKLPTASRQVAAAPLLTRAAVGTGEGAGYGAAYGFGTGEGTQNRLEGAGVGALFGAGVGGALPLAGAAVRQGTEIVSDSISPVIRSMRQPDIEAARRVASAQGRGGPSLSRADEAAAAINGQGLLNVDRGGETTRALARSVANQNPEARAALTRVANDRFGSQGPRAQSLIDRLVGGQVDDLAYQEQLTQAAQRANRPRYEAAMQSPAAQSVFDRDLAQLMQSPAMQQAVKEASTRGADRAAVEGFQAIRNPFEFTDAGVRLARRRDGSVATPNLRFWDQVKRNLDSKIGQAQRGGDKTSAADLVALKSKLVEKLDGLVPQYKTARQGAAAFFGAENALEAGKKFVTQNQSVPKAMVALAKMPIAEREAFKVGFAAQLREQINSVRDRSNVIDRIFGTQRARQKIRAVLGPQGYREVETFARVENQMDMLRNAITGNSTTARQLAELGIGAGLGAYSGGDLSSALTGAALVRGMSALGGYATQKANQKVMEKIADILLSTDPQMIARGTKEIAKSEAARKALTQTQRYLERMLAVPAAGAVSASSPSPL